MKKTQFLSIILSLCLLFSLVGCGDTPKSNSNYVKDYSLYLSAISNEVDQHSSLQKNYLSDDYTSVGKYANGHAEKSIPDALDLIWTTTTNINNAPAITEYTVLVSPSADFSENVWTYTCTQTALSVYNLMINCDYYWKVEATLENGKKVSSKIEHFKTADVYPRMLYVDGVTNVRDIGGWNTENEKKVKQGLLFRCGRLNESSSSKLKIEITKAGKTTMRDYLKIKTEIDLRTVLNNEVGCLTNTSPLGKTVQYVQCPMEYSVSNLITGNRQQLSAIFAILSEKSNYPIIFHCNIGTDRTGVIAFLVNGLLGVSEEDLYRDYLLSNFGNIGGSRKVATIQDNYVNYIKLFDGDTLSQKIYNCLVENGVPSQYLDAVIDILI